METLILIRATRGYWNYTDCNRHGENENPLGSAEVDHSFTVWFFWLHGAKTDWESGHRAVWCKSLFCPIVESDVCPYILRTAEIFMLHEQRCSFSVLWKAVNTCGKGSVGRVLPLEGVFSTLDIVGVLDRVHKHLPPPQDKCLITLVCLLHMKDN